MLKIAISGKAKSGKNTVAELIQACLPFLYVKQLAFADPIKEMIKIMFPTTSDEWLWGSSELRQNIIQDADKSVREISVMLGKLGRSLNQDIWINSIFERIVPSLDAVIISDCRFLNEFERIKNDQFITFRVTRSTNDFIFNDISETELDAVPDSEFDFVIDNSFSLENLRMKIEIIMGQIKQ